MPEELETRAEDAAVEPGAALLEAVKAELEVLYGPLVLGGTPSATPEEMGPPGGRFLVVYRGGRAIAGGGVKRLSEGVGEIKRMYVVPDERGRGVARALLIGLEDAARDLGYSLLRLDTGPKQPHAQALYASAGYRAIPDYNRNVYASFWFEKEL